MAPSPVGIELLKGSKPKWRVGKELGSGACATVHLLEEIDGTPTELAIKLTPIPTKKTKKQNSIEEVNSSRLYFEHVVYHNQFQDVQGTFIPKLAPYKGPQPHGEAGGKQAARKEVLRGQRLSDFLTVPSTCFLSLRQASVISLWRRWSINFWTLYLSCFNRTDQRKPFLLDLSLPSYWLVFKPFKNAST
jgi:hypothetical protein